MDLERQWASLCGDVESVSRALAESLDERFGQMLDDEATRFCALSCPTTEHVLHMRRMQRAALAGKIKALADAGMLAMFNRQAAPGILGEAEILLKQELPIDEHELPEFHCRLTAFSSRLSSVLAGGSPHG